ncbi:MAG: hypothetical protein FWE55_03670 [Synergistaceae bacterium]|nr:hypothetical protein [Synergistaceae bacterium]
MLWNNSFETGVREVDKQNFDLIIRVSVMMQPDERGMLLMYLENFEMLAKKNFDREQALHYRCRYSDGDQHKLSHEAYISKLQQVKRNLIENAANPENENILIKDVFEFLKNHIMLHDKRFAYFYHNNIMCENFLRHDDKPYATAI